MKGKKCTVTLCVGLLIVLYMVTGCRPKQPEVELLSQYVHRDVFTNSNEDWDWGYKLIVRARNKGSTCKVRVIAELRTQMEGQFYRERTVDFSGGETQELTFLFLEPSFFSEGGDIEHRIRYEFAN